LALSRSGLILRARKVKDGPDDTTIASLIDHDLWQAVRRDFGLEDGWVRDQRRRLSAILFT